MQVADKIIAFWDGFSRGTKFTIDDYARAQGKEVLVHVFDKNMTIKQISPSDSLRLI